jgi:hypothetical protein
MSAGFFLCRQKHHKAESAQRERRNPDRHAQRLTAGKKHQRGKKHLAEDKELEKSPSIARFDSTRRGRRVRGVGEKRVSSWNGWLHQNFPLCF